MTRFAILALVQLAASAAVAAQPSAPSACHVVRGRMELFNGAPAVRIAVTGTGRILGVDQPNESFADLPAPVRALWPDGKNDANWASAIWGDFTVCPLTESRPGRMQKVRVTDARRLVLQPRH